MSISFTWSWQHGMLHRFIKPFPSHGTRSSGSVTSRSWKRQTLYHNENCCLNKKNTFWLVVYLPLWKIWLRQLGWWNSHMDSHKLPWFQTTKHCTLSNLEVPYFLDQPFVATHWWSVWTTVRSLSGKVGPMWLAFPWNKTPVSAQGYYVRWKLALVCLVCWYIWYCRCLKITMKITSH
jgi:hypothetical protein